MDQCPNLYVDIAARISEQGRQPFSSRRFFEKLQDRILFGPDSGPDLDTCATYARFLESDDEYFSYAPDNHPGQGCWMIYGLHLSYSILNKAYHDNAARLFGLWQGFWDSGYDMEPFWGSLVWTHGGSSTSDDGRRVAGR